MRRAIWELSPLILFTLWLFGALPLIHLNKGSIMADSTNSLWPSIISGLFAFVGVIAGLAWNARQTPKTEDRLRANARAVLRTSLWAELTSLAKLMREEIDYIKENDFTWIPLVQSFQIYIANLPNLGLLTPGQARKITEAYYQYQESAGYIAQMARDQPDKPAIGRHIPYDFAKSDSPTKQDVINALDAIASKAEDAAQELKPQLPEDENSPATVAAIVSPGSQSQGN